MPDKLFPQKFNLISHCFFFVRTWLFRAKLWIYILSLFIIRLKMEWKQGFCDQIKNVLYLFHEINSLYSKMNDQVNGESKFGIFLFAKYTLLIRTCLLWAFTYKSLSFEWLFFIEIHQWFCYRDLLFFTVVMFPRL